MPRLLDAKRLACRPTSYIANQNFVPLGKTDIERFVGHYLNDMSESADARIDIVGSAVLADLPPVTIVAAKIEPLNFERMLLLDKLEAAGVEVAYQNWNGVTHEFVGMAAVGPEAKEAQDFAGAEPRRRLCRIVHPAALAVSSVAFAAIATTQCPPQAANHIV